MSFKIRSHKHSVLLAEPSVGLLVEPSLVLLAEPSGVSWVQLSGGRLEWGWHKGLFFQSCASIECQRLTKLLF